MIEILITRPDVYESIGDGRLDEGLVPIVGNMAPNAEVSPSWYVRDRLRNYSGRYVVVIVDLRVHWSLVGPVFLTTRKTLAVRNEIHMSWKAAYMYDDYTIVYHRAWDYGDLTPNNGEHKRSRDDVRLNVTIYHLLFEVRGDDAQWDAFVRRVRAPGLPPELHPQRRRK